MRIGFIGVGRMGAPMARRLAGAGHAVAVSDRDAAAAGALSAIAGVTVAGEVAHAVDGAEAVITMLPDDAAVGSVAPAIAAALAPGAVWADMSTAYPPEAANLSAALPEGAAFVDAPVSGGVGRAKSGELTIMAGGDAAALDRLAAPFAAMGRLVRTGPLGSGRAMKLLNNYLSASGLVAACEAVSIGRAFGLDPDLMADVFNTSTGRSNATEVKLKQHVNNGAFASGFALGLMAKDLRLGRRLAKALGDEAEGLIACQALYDRAERALGPDADHTEIAKLIGRV